MKIIKAVPNSYFLIKAIEKNITVMEWKTIYERNGKSLSTNVGNLC
jgi:predicted O-linked N-acetylglucosamine transferase (SPINDLY family)